MRRHLFLTGATGFVGRNLLYRILKFHPDTKISCLIRAHSQVEAEKRFNELQNTMGEKVELEKLNECCEVLVGDVTLPGLGLSRTDFKRLAQSITHIIHSAANVSFQMSLSEARRINVTGTKNVLQLAEQAKETGQFQLLVYLSTAYVCGNRNGTLYENELDCGQEFENSYQQSKCEAEQSLNRRKDCIPITIFRPSIIVGHSKTGCTSVFNVIYYPLKMLSRGFLRFIPGSPQTPLDVVPINYVCNAIIHISLCSEKGIGKTFHLTSGPDAACNIRELAKMAVEYFNKTQPENRIKFPKFVSPRFYYLARFFSFSGSRKFLKKFEQYLPFLSGAKNFDQSNTRAALEGTSIAVPQFYQYFEKLMQYCQEVDWGRQDLSLA